MRLQSIHPEDLVLCSIKRRRVYGEVSEIADGRVYLQPLCPGGGWRHAYAREIIGHWRKGRRRNQDADVDRAAGHST